MIVTHGNGPQVGLLALESANDSTLTRPYPLDVLGAETQGMIGYLLAQALRNELPSDREAVTVVTETLVSANDPGFAEPTGGNFGDLVVAPFTYSDGTCDYCRVGLHTSCVHGGQWGVNGVDGGQGQATRVPYADGTLVPLPVGEDSELLPDLLTLSDVLCTGYHAAHTAGIRAGESVTVIGDGAVGLSAVIAAKLLGAEQIILMGRHNARTDLGREFGATDVVAARGQEGVAAARELTGGHGSTRVLECVGLKDALVQAAGVVRDGGTISRVGAPQYPEVPLGFPEFLRNITLTGGVAPARAYIQELMPHILGGAIRPGRVFDRTVALEDVAEGYRLMNEREALKVIVRP